MSSRAKQRSSTSATRSTDSASTGTTNGDQVTSSLPHERPQSPLGNHLMSRIQEKEQLSGLNDRLAAYIDKVRSLESENSRLTLQINTHHETSHREVTSIKTMFQKELSETRKSLDNEAREKAKYKMDLDKLKGEFETLQTRFNKREKDANSLEKRLTQLEQEAENLRARANQALTSQRKTEEDLKEITGERDRLAKANTTLRNQLEGETLERVNLENNVASLKEELKFASEMHQQEMEETRTIQEQEISQIVSEGMREQYQERLADELHALRADYEGQLKACREEMEGNYERELRDLRVKLEQRNTSTQNIRNEIKSYKDRNDMLTSQMAQLESANAALNQRVTDLQNLLAQEREWHEDALRAKDEEIAALREELKQQEIEYQQLMEIKMSLDLEINAYRKLLEGEESRLNISSNTSQTSQSMASNLLSPPRLAGSPRYTPSRSGGSKRKRVVLEQEEENVIDVVVNSDAKGDVEINDQDPDGKFVKVYNKGEKEISLGGWQLNRVAGEKNTHFKFHRSVMVKPKSEVTVWSSDSGMTHNPPTDILMKGNTWFVADNMTTVLINSDGQEMATRQTTKKKRTSIAQRTSLGRLSLGRGEQDGQERCLMM